MFMPKISKSLSSIASRHSLFSTYQILGARLMKKLNPFYIIEVLILISLLFGFHSPAFSEGGRNVDGSGKIGGGKFGGGSDAGGGGTFVESKKSHQFIFWDLYVNNTEVIDNESGDHIEITDYLNKSHPGIWIDYRQLKSFLYLKERLSKWKPRARKLINLITHDGIMLREAASEYQGFYFLFLGTPLTINNIYEISVPSNFSTKNLNVFSGAFFDQNTERIFLNLPVWNHANLKSQAACILHERIRNIQLDFNLTNEEVQKIVYYIIEKDPEEVSELDYDDNVFSPLNYGPAHSLLNFPKGFTEDLGKLFGYNTPVIGRYLYKEEAISKTYELDTGFECQQKNRMPGQRLNETYQYSAICPSLNTTEKEIKAAVDSGVLTYEKLRPRKLMSNGKWNNDFKKTLFHLTFNPSVILDSHSCVDILAEHKDPTYFNSYRFPLYCSRGKLTGTGRLYFETSFQEIFEVEIKADLSVSSDSGSEIVLDVMGNEVKLYYGDIPKGVHNIVFRYDFNNEKISVVLNDNGLYKTNPPLQQRPFKNKVFKTSRIDFMFGIYNHSTIESVRLLDSFNK